MRKRHLIAILLAVLVTSCDAGGPPQADGLAKTEEIGRAAVGAAQCLRDRGYQVPDPTFNDEGLPQFGEMPGLVKSPEFDEARQACFEPLNQALQAAGVPNAKEVKPEEFLGFARCMREHGIGIPDPTAEDPIQIPKNAFSSPAWQPAVQACESLVPEGWHKFLEPATGPDVKQGGGR